MSDSLNSLDIVIPVLNEEQALENSIETLMSFCEENIGAYDWVITVADNGSTDQTVQIAQTLSKKYSKVQYVRLEERGRGRALKKAWAQSGSKILAYMDVDLSTDLISLPDCVAAVNDSKTQIATGSRLISGSEVVGRSFKREFISRGYSLLFRMMFRVSFRDAQCGFKVVSKKVVEEVVPLVKNNNWFFDTELLILAEKNGYPIMEIPVRWVDDPLSKVNIMKTAIEDIKGLMRLRFRDVGRS
ncbi:glycosyltransferase, partial [Chloroflexi bacterium]|nr:glycosyltransferase [Chloroflexota bacterium]